MDNKIYKINIILIILVLILLIFNIKNYFSNSNVSNSINKNNTDILITNDNIETWKDRVEKNININNNEKKFIQTEKSVKNNEKKEDYNISVSLLNVYENYIEVLLNDTNKKFYYNKNTKFYTYNVLSDSEYQKLTKKNKELLDNPIVDKGKDWSSTYIPEPILKEYIEEFNDIKDLKLSKDDDLEISYIKNWNIFLLLDVIKK